MPKWYETIIHTLTTSQPMPQQQAAGRRLTPQNDGGRTLVSTKGQQKLEQALT